MITAENITDEQIRDIRSQAVRNLAAYELTVTLEVIAICDSALNPRCHDARHDAHRNEARARCAEILNALAERKPDGDK